MFRPDPSRPARGRRAAAAALLTALLLPVPAALAAPQEFDARAFRIEDLIGEVTVTVATGTGRIGVSLDGPADLVDRTSVTLRNGEVVLDQDLDGLGRRTLDRDDTVRVRVSVPAGSAVTVGNLIGEARIGDLDGPLTLALTSAAEVETGRVARADLRISGAGSVTVGDVAGALKLTISGAGDVTTGAVAGPADVSISGTGQVEIAAVSGPVSIEMSGMADVAVRGGHTPRLEASISGLGSLSFDGVADSRSIRNSGIASVRIRDDGGR
ncbi:GIN domain-containing protein [Rhodocista pekingensis]|uniref:GIN domain-containing protein n=1 Tax=Rhodocista pekingensis TaxID=201185 RepID=A0ABW2KVM1_9PROT